MGLRVRIVLALRSLMLSNFNRCLQNFNSCVFPASWAFPDANVIYKLRHLFSTLRAGWVILFGKVWLSRHVQFSAMENKRQSGRLT